MGMLQLVVATEWRRQLFAVGFVRCLPRYHGWWCAQIGPLLIRYDPLKSFLCPTCTSCGAQLYGPYSRGVLSTCCQAPMKSGWHGVAARILRFYRRHSGDEEVE